MMSAILSFNTTALLQGDVVPPTIYIATSSLPKNAMIEWQVMLGLQSSSSTDDSDDDERSPISLTQRPQTNCTTCKHFKFHFLSRRILSTNMNVSMFLAEKNDVTVETQWWSSNSVYFATSCAAIDGIYLFLF
jgi:hypothetical protein